MVYGKIRAFYGIFCIISDLRCNDRVAIFPDLISRIMASSTLNLSSVIQQLEDEYNDSDNGGISSGEEEDLDRRLAASDSDFRQVFICF